MRSTGVLVFALLFFVASCDEVFWAKPVNPAMTTTNSTVTTSKPKITTTPKSNMTTITILNSNMTTPDSNITMITTSKLNTTNSTMMLTTTPNPVTTISEAPTSKPVSSTRRSNRSSIFKPQNAVKINTNQLHNDAECPRGEVCSGVGSTTAGAFVFVLMVAMFG
ncbi:hypothetical protein QR680_003551 [Steinernema hermaphroditum]|uniref:Uncharacterized protein n=1 Tax=Steinernema hermaphroditum TaxID=289476 RepID=A0AA39HM56_9BILA|nr:hypothetical protein QR680_003551 [Steinernema hermaphroditum]